MPSDWGMIYSSLSSSTSTSCWVGGSQYIINVSWDEDDEPELEVAEKKQERKLGFFK